LAPKGTGAHEQQHNTWAASPQSALGPFAAARLAGTAAATWDVAGAPRDGVGENIQLPS